MATYYLLIYVAVVLAAAGQVMLKLGTDRKGVTVFTWNVNLWVALAVLAMIGSILLNVRALHVVPLSHMAFILPTVYVLVPLFARIFLKEHLHRHTIIGTLIIIIGVLIFNLPVD